MMRKIVLSNKKGLLEFDFDGDYLMSFVVTDETKHFDNTTTIEDVVSLKGYKVAYDSDINTYEDLAKPLGLYIGDENDS